MSILVGYTNSLGGQDACAYGMVLAKAFTTSLDLVMMLPIADDVSRLTPGGSGYQQVLHDQAEAWLTEAAQDGPDGVTTNRHIRYAESFSEGLLKAAEEFSPTALVIGGGRHGVLGQVSLGSVGNVLLHSASVPVVLAPRGIRHRPPKRVSRITAMVGKRAGNRRLLDEAMWFARELNAELRLISLVMLDNHHDRESAEAHAQKLLDQAQAGLPQGFQAESSIASAEHVEDAVAALEWRPDEIAMAGSSRLAQPRRLYLGSTVNKVLRVLPVPLITVPRGDEGRPES